MENLFDDYLKATRDVQGMWENRMSQMMDEFVKSQSFLKAMTASLESSLDGRRVFENALNRWAELFGVVTKKDIDTINRQMYDQNIRLEKMVELLTDIREDLQGKAPAKPVATPAATATTESPRTEFAAKSKKNRA